MGQCEAGVSCEESARETVRDIYTSILTYACSPFSTPPFPTATPPLCTSDAHAALGSAVPTVYRSLQDSPNVRFMFFAVYAPHQFTQ